MGGEGVPEAWCRAAEGSVAHQEHLSPMENINLQISTLSQVYQGVCLFDGLKLWPFFKKKSV